MTNQIEACNPELPKPPGPEPPRIYCASLSDYNAGFLHGVWLDAAREDHEIWADINDMLEAGPQVHAEEFAIHDHEGFGGWSVNEYESIPVVAAVARAIVEHGPAVAAWLDHRGDTAPETIDGFECAYLGEWASMTTYAEHLIEELGVTITVEPDAWARYVKFDSEQFGRDLSVDLVSSRSPDGGLYVFDPNID